MSDYDRAEFLANLKALGLSQATFADRLSFSRDAVYHWGTSDVQPFPAWVPLLLNAWLQVKLLSERLEGGNGYKES